ncbi:peptidyl-prolyl cis-trans isomerase FKBP8 [Culicoides brevitarsis]|uniref:peptidyl-prolyl cis-trans isomerase FKBP8 n=1 Tax=Culicoides brevitarsis TaxID=469753 RepID=UPI00307BB0B8
MEEKSSSSSFEDLTNFNEQEIKEATEAAAAQEAAQATTAGDVPVDTPDFLDVLGNGQLTKRILVKGEAGNRPQREDICKINLVGKLENGTVVEELKNESVQVGNYEVVQGIDMALPLMDVGEKAEIVCNARFAYGEIGFVNEDDAAKNIPPNATVTYTVELLSTKEEDEEEQGFEVRKRVGNKKRERGNFWFERNEYNMAIQCYRKALQYLDEASVGVPDDPRVKTVDLTNEQLQELLEDRIRVNNNLAMAQMKVEAWDAALKSVESVLSCKPDNVKALFRKGKILDAKGQVNAAIPLLQKAATLDPENRAIQNELSKMILKQKREARNEKDLYQKMLGQAQKLEQKSKQQKTTTTEESKFKLWGYLMGTILIGVAGIAMYRYNYV